jgi:hypothetical protein
MKLAHDRVQWRALVLAVLNLGVVPPDSCFGLCASLFLV